MSHSLSEQVAVIMGGTGNIGYACAKQLATAGAKVILLYYTDENNANELLAKLPGSGHGIIQADISATPTLKNAKEIVAAKWGHVNILVNAAGMSKIIPHADLEALSDELIDQIFISNWRGPFATIREFTPLLRKSGNGLVVNISSIAATTGVGSNVAYCAAKAGIDIMANCLGRALAPEIRVLNVAPGVVDTSFLPGRDEEWNKKTATTIPLKRVGTVEDIADAVLACATTLYFSTGSVIQVDGGRHL